MDELLAPILDELKRRGISATAVSNAAVGNPSALKNLLVRRGKTGRNHPIENLMAIANYLGFELTVSAPHETASAYALSAHEQVHLARLADAVKVAEPDFVPVPLIDVTLAAGAGTADSAERVIDHLAFRRDWLTRINIQPTAARLARVTGSSMVPTLCPDDMVLIDTSKTEPPIRRRDPKDRRRAAIWALADGDGARVKRIDRPQADQIFLISDNPAHQPEMRTAGQLADLRIIGKVVWWGHTVRD
ncbi:MAG: S24 family peptidase [Paracoccus sp. (in: a-proteobacteria)]|nr:S24 family peptidase [Paracoccus sp. (in: a-proteobacteria)]